MFETTTQKYFSERKFWLYSVVNDQMLPLTDRWAGLTKILQEWFHEGYIVIEENWFIPLNKMNEEKG